MTSFYVVAGDRRHFERWSLLRLAAARQEAPDTVAELRFVEVTRPTDLTGVTLKDGDEIIYCGTWQHQPYWLINGILIRQRLLEDRRAERLASV